MKRELFIVLTAFCLILSGERYLAKEAEHNDWTIEEVKDEFGDTTGEKYIINVSEGTFSNDKVKDAAFDSFVSYYPERHSFSFHLMENEISKIATANDDEPLLKIKLEDMVYEYDLLNDTHEDGFLLSFDSNPTGYIQIWNSLLDGADIKCLIYVGDTKCQFIIPARMFSEATEPFNRDAYNEAKETFQKKDFSQAKSMFFQLGEYLDSTNQAASAYEAEIRQQYESALEYFSNGEYDEAKKMLINLDGYLDSTDMIRKCEEAIETEHEANAPDISGTVIKTTADSLTVQDVDGNTFSIDISEAEVTSTDGIYDGVYVSIYLDNTKSSSNNMLYAIEVIGY